MINAGITGKRIARLRKQKGMTQKDLAKELSVTDKAISKWERGLNFPDLTLLEPLADALDTTVIHLLSLENTITEEAVDVITKISALENIRILHELRKHSYIKICIEAVIFVAAIIASKIMADNGIFGFGQMASMGMLGFAGTLIGTELYAIHHLRELILSYNSLLEVPTASS